MVILLKVLFLILDTNSNTNANNITSLK